MKILVFDIEITGHHSEYIAHLVDFVFHSKNNYHNYYFIVHPDFSDKFPEIVKKNSNPLINFISITNLQFNDLFITKGEKLQDTINPYKIYNLLTEYVNSIRPNRCILMYFDYFIFPLLFRRPKFEVYGILFSTFFRETGGNDFASKIRYYRKRILTFLYTRNNRIKSIFILNDCKAVEVLNKRVRKNVFCYLPDPIPEIEEEPDYNIRNIYKIEPSKKILLHFGSLRESKGTFDIIQSLNLLSDAASLKCCLIIAGRPKNISMEKKIQENIDSVNKVQIIYINHFLSDKRMKSFFNQCDIILMPYKNSQASSGVIGHAIASEKPVISTQHGLIGEIINNNWKGELLDVIEPNAIASAIEKSISTIYPLVSNISYIDEHAPSNFARVILERY